MAQLHERDGDRPGSWEEGGGRTRTGSKDRGGGMWGFLSGGDLDDERSMTELRIGDEDSRRGMITEQGIEERTMTD